MTAKLGLRFDLMFAAVDTELSTAFDLFLNNERKKAPPRN
jgi:hypothetical protein